MPITKDAQIAKAFNLDGEFEKCTWKEVTISDGIASMKLEFWTNGRFRPSITTRAYDGQETILFLSPALAKQLGEFLAQAPQVEEWEPLTTIQTA